MEFVISAFWRSNYSKSLSASEICNLHLNFFQKQGMLQPCRSNNLKNLIFKPSAAISVKIRDFRVFLAKPSLKNICDPLVHWNLSLQRFGDQTNTKICWEAINLYRAFSETSSGCRHTEKKKAKQR